MKTPKYEEAAIAAFSQCYSSCLWRNMSRTVKGQWRRFAQAVIKAHEKKNKP